MPATPPAIPDTQGTRLAEKNRKEQILDAAIALLQAKGFTNVSTRDLAEHAGLSRSHIYHYFKDWPTLRREAFARYSDQQLAEARQAFAGLPARQALASFLRECLPEAPDSCFTLWLDAWNEALHDGMLAGTYRDVDARWLAWLAELLQQGVAQGDFICPAPSRAARQIFSMTVGYAEDLLLSPSRQAADNALDEVLEAAGLILRVREPLAAPPP